MRRLVARCPACGCEFPVDVFDDEPDEKCVLCPECGSLVIVSRRKRGGHAARR